MLVSSPTSLLTGLSGTVQKLENQLQTTETEMSTGQYANIPQTLGSQFGVYQTLLAQSDTLTNMQGSNGIILSNMSVANDALTSMSTDAQNFINTLITAESTGDVSTLQSQAQTLLTSLTTQLNATSGGEYVFGGDNSSVAPMGDYSQGPQAATAAAFTAAFGFPQTSSQVDSISASDMQTFLSGGFADLFNAANWSANWSTASSTPTSSVIMPGETIATSVTANDPGFRALADAYTSIADLNIQGLSPATQQTVIGNALSEASSAMSGIEGMQSTLGIAQSQITTADTRLQAQVTLLQNQATQMGTPNSYTTATQLSEYMTQIETAYSLTDRISKLGLVNYLST